MVVKLADYFSIGTTTKCSVGIELQWLPCSSLRRSLGTKRRWKREVWTVHMGIAAVAGVSPNLVRRGDFVQVPLVVQMLDYLLCRGFYCHLL